MPTGLDVYKHQDCCPHHAPLSLSQILSLHITGKLPLDNLVPNTIFKEEVRVLCSLFTLFSLQCSEFSFRISDRAIKNLHPEHMSNYYIFSAIERNASLGLR